MKSIKTKLILAISILVIGLLSLAAVLLVREKIEELEADIYQKARTFAELVSPKILENYNLYLKEGSFIYFNREMQGIFRQNEDISGIKVVNFGGEVLYDSWTEKQRRYEGQKRKIHTDQLDTLKAPFPSIIQERDEILYLKKDSDGNYEFADKEGNALTPAPKIKRLTNIIFPLENQFAVIYDVSYRHLEERIDRTVRRIVLLAVFGIVVGLITAYVLAIGLTKPLLKVKEVVLLIAKGDFKKRVEVKVKDEVGVVAAAVNQMAVELEASMQARIYQERVGKELELATEIQKQFIPDKLTQIPSLDVAAKVDPAGEVGGDVYDMIAVGPDSAVMYLGDVTGHGVPSGIVSAIANALVFSYAPKMDLKSMMVEANKVLVKKTRPNMFITMVVAKWDGEKKACTYVNAGHERVVRYQAKTKQVTELEEGGMALGLFPKIDQKLEERAIAMDAGDCLVLYSDGVPEAWKNEKEIYGMERFKESVMKAASTLATADEIKNALFSDVAAFTGGYEQKDDITIMVIKKK